MTVSYACYDACMHVPEMIDYPKMGIVEHDSYGMGDGLDYYGNDRK